MSRVSSARYSGFRMRVKQLTGMRRGELLSLRWIDIEIPNSRLYLRETKKGRLRVLRLNSLAVQVLLSLPQGLPHRAKIAALIAPIEYAPGRWRHRPCL